MHKSLLFTTIALIGAASAATDMGACPTPVLQENFDPPKYMGLWYQQMRDKKSPFEDYECATTQYALNEDGSVSVLNAQYNNNTDKVETVNATATFKGAQGSVVFFWYAPPGDYRILATDYKDFALVYGCSE